jgi:hypothetical protein
MLPPGKGEASKDAKAAIHTQIVKSRPPYSRSLTQMTAFVIARSGGASGQFLTELQAFHRWCVTPSIRMGLPAAVYGAIAEFPYHYVALAFFKTAYTGPQDKIDNGFNWARGRLRGKFGLV